MNLGEILSLRQVVITKKKGVGGGSVSRHFGSSLHSKLGIFICGLFFNL